MFSLRNRFGIPGVISVIALVFAMLGGAYAASDRGSNNSKASASAKVKKGPRGPRGPKGAIGPPGPAGPQGPAGPAGANGKDGANGAQGPQGLQGDTGEAGMCSEANPDCSLAPGATLAGVWGTSGGSGGTGNDMSMVPVSFPVNVSPAPTVIYPYTPIPGLGGVELKDGERNLYGPYPDPEEIETEEQIEEVGKAYEEACPGTVDEPKAAPGVLCFYVGKKSGGASDPANIADEGLLEAANEFGVVIPFSIGAGARRQGSWAVTAGN